MTDANEKKGSSSRLDRLLKLLDSGSTSLARAQAAEQIGELVLQSCTSSSSNTGGEVSKVNVNAGMLPTVLRKVRECSRAKEWETRVAAGKAMGAIAKNLRRKESSLYLDEAQSNDFVPNNAFCASARDVCKMELIEYELVLEKVAGERANRAKEQRTSLLDEEVKEARDEVTQILDLKLENFDIESVLNKGIVLLSSTGDEWSNAERGPGTKTERLERAKMNLKKTLGMELGKEAAAFGLDSKAIGEMVTEKDLVGDDDDFESLDKKKKKAASKKRKKGSADEDDIEVKKEEGAAARLVDSLEGNNGNAEDDFDEEKLRAQGMSAREVNKLKRKNKRLRAAGKTVVKHHQSDDFKDDGEEEDKKKKSATKSGGASAADVNEQQRKHEEMEEKQRQERTEEAEEMLDRKQRELLEEEISAEEYGENPETKPAHLEAKASSLREDAIALEEAADMARKRIERHRRQRTRELENRAKELRDEARDLERKAYALREDEADYGGKYYRDGGIPRDGV